MTYMTILVMYQAQNMLFMFSLLQKTQKPLFASQSPPTAGRFFVRTKVSAGLKAAGLTAKIFAA